MLARSQNRYLEFAAEMRSQADAPAFRSLQRAMQGFISTPRVKAFRARKRLRVADREVFVPGFYIGESLLEEAVLKALLTAVPLQRQSLSRNEYDDRQWAIKYILADWTASKRPSRK